MGLKRLGFEGGTGEDRIKREKKETKEENAERSMPTENGVWELPLWGDGFEANAIDERFERRQPTEAEIQRMDRNLAKLAEVMATAQAGWQLDGALNISLYNKGKYIGIHKDVDISVEIEDLVTFERDMLQGGYAFFENVSRPNYRGARRIRRVSAADILSRKIDDSLSLMRISASGEVVGDEELNDLDLHIIRRDNEGKPMGRRGLPLPKTWFQPRRLTIKDGKEINASSPARLIYYKLHQGREYDYTDLNRFIETGVVSVEDIDDVFDIFNQEHEAEKERINRIILPMANEIVGAKSVDEVLAAFRKSSEIGADVDNPERMERLLALAKRFVEMEKRDGPLLIQETNSFMGIDENHERRIAVLHHLRGRVVTRSE